MFIYVNFTNMNLSNNVLIICYLYEIYLLDSIENLIRYIVIGVITLIDIFIAFRGLKYIKKNAAIFPLYRQLCVSV